MAESINIGRSVSRGWKLFWENWVYLVICAIVTTVIITLAMISLFFLAMIPLIIGPLVLLIAFFLFFPLLGGLWYAVRRAARGDVLLYGAVFEGFNAIFPILLSTLISGVIIRAPYLVAGLISLFLGSVDGLFKLLAEIVSFVISVRFMFIYFYIVDGMGAVDSLKASWRATGGNWLMAFLFWIVVSIITGSSVLLVSIYVPGSIDLFGSIYVPGSIDVLGGIYVLGLVIIGTLFTFPLGLCITNAAYEQLEGKEYTEDAQALAKESATPPLPPRAPARRLAPATRERGYRSGEYIHHFVFLEGTALDDVRAREIVAEKSPDTIKLPHNPVVTGRGLSVWPKSKQEFMKIVSMEIGKYTSQVANAPGYLDKDVFKVIMKSGKDKSTRKNLVIMSIVAR